VRERKWEKALNDLVDSIPGLTVEWAIQILSGDKKFEGVNNFRLHPDNDEKYKKHLAWMYAGYIQDGDHWYQPYVCVTDYGYKDIVNPAIRKQVETRQKHVDKNKFLNPMIEFGGRALHYGDEKTNHVALLEVPGDGAQLEFAVLFKRVSSPPFWMHSALKARSKSPQDALNDFCKTNQRTLEARGHIDYYGHETPAATLGSRGRKEETSEEKKARYDRQEQEYQARIADLRARIQKEADKTGWIEIKDADSIVKVPKAAFENWALGRAHARHLATAWTPISPSGMKLPNDDPYHTDWMLGAGFDLDCRAGTRHDDPYYEKLYELQKDRLNFKCAVLSGTGETHIKRVRHPKEDEEVPEDSIIVIKDASAKYLKPVSCIRSGAVIVERGGSVAHLANIAREQGVRMVRVENARKVYPIGTAVSVDCDNGAVEISPLPYRAKIDDPDKSEE